LGQVDEGGGKGNDGGEHVGVIVLLLLLLLLLLLRQPLVASTHGLVARPMRCLVLLAAVMSDTARCTLHQGLVVTHAVVARG
jgi:hypothetical protein